MSVLTDKSSGVAGAPHAEEAKSAAKPNITNIALKRFLDMSQGPSTQRATAENRGFTLCVMQLAMTPVSAKLPQAGSYGHLSG